MTAPTQKGQSPFYHSPPPPAPLPLHHSNFNQGSPLPSISAALNSRGTTGSQYYDPTTDHVERPPPRYGYPEAPHYEKPYHSPVAAAFPPLHSPLQRPPSQRRTSGGMEAMSHSPVSPTVYGQMNRGAVQPPPANYARRTSSVKEEVCPNSASTLHVQPLMITAAAPATHTRRPHVSLEHHVIRR